MKKYKGKEAKCIDDTLPDDMEDGVYDINK